MRILGLDPGFANMGCCIASYIDGNLQVQRMGVIETKKDQRKVLVSVDNLKRCQSLFEKLLDFMWSSENGEPVLLVDAIAVEAMSHPRNASSAEKVSMAWGVIAAASALSHVPVVQSQPQDIKEAVTGSRKASKAQMESVLGSMYPEALEALEGVPMSRREHSYDALGAVIASLGSEVVKMGALMTAAEEKE